MTFPVWLQIASDVAKTITAVVGVSTARNALTTWRRQLVATHDFELSRRIVRCLLRVRERMLELRTPSFSREDINAAYDDLGKAHPPAIVPSTSDLFHVYSRRARTLRGALADLQVELFEGEVLWGPELKPPSAALSALADRVMQAIAQVYPEEHRSAPSAAMNELARVDRTGSGDPTTKEMDAVIAQFEEAMQGRLLTRRSKPSAWHRIIRAKSRAT